MEEDSITIQVLKQIRDEVAATRTDLAGRLDQTNARLDQTNERLDQTNERLGAVEDALVDIRRPTALCRKVAEGRNSKGSRP